MSEQERTKRIEEHLPTVKAVIDEYRAQGRELTEAEAEKIRERLRADLAVGHVDARDDVLGDDVLDNVAGGGGGGPAPTRPPTPGGGDDSSAEYGPRP